MKIKAQIFCAFVLLWAAFSYTAAEEEKKKLKLVLDRLDKVKDAEHILKTDLTFDRVDDEEVKINGQVVQVFDMDDEYQITSIILHSAEKEGEYKKVFGMANVGVCHFMAHQYKKYFYETLQHHANAPEPDKCPVTQETYIVKDYPLDSSKFQKFLLHGFYRIVTTLIHKDEEVLQYDVEAHTEEE